ncbi:MAG TPA: DUF6542 domain-containing protein [Acidothermaceae bacterium]|nr:DUF6542 domain-containing protein [Acidothermaceae bacterium]
MSEPAEHLFAEPLFVEPVLEPLSPPQADLAAVPVRRIPEMPGLALSGPALSGALLSGAVLLEGTGPKPTALQPATPPPAASLPPPAEPAAAHPAAPTSAATQTRPQGGLVVSGRGVTGRGVVVLILVLTGLVGLLEVAFAGHRGAAFAFVFIFTSAVGALVVRRRDLPTSIFAPPLLYCVLITALSVVDTHDQNGGFITRKAVYIGNAFVTGAPTLWTGTVIAAAIVWYRHRAERKPRS